MKAVETPSQRSTNMSQPTRRASRLSCAICLVLLAPWVGGCPAAVSAVLDVLDEGGVTIIIDRPTECFQEDVIATDCFTEETTVCEEDFFGFLDCFTVIELVCEDVVIDSFLVCE